MSVWEPVPKRSLRLRDDVQLIGLQSLDDLFLAGGPANQDAAGAVAPEPEMQTPVVLAAEPAAAIHHLPLAHIAELARHLGADRAAITPGAHELQLNPMGTVRR